VKIVAVYTNQMTRTRRTDGRAAFVNTVDNLIKYGAQIFDESGNPIKSKAFTLTQPEGERKDYVSNDKGWIPISPKRIWAFATFKEIN
jgi:hypothetical protein